MKPRPRERPDNSRTPSALPSEADREFAAVVLHTGVVERSRAKVAMRNRLAALERAGVRVLLLDGDGRHALSELAEIGIGPGLVLVIGDGFEPDRLPTRVTRFAGQNADLRRALDAILGRRRNGRVPSLDEDPDWVLHEDGPLARRQRVCEALFTVGAGGIGTRGSLEEQPPGSVPLVLAAGVYGGEGADQQLLPAPDWTYVGVDPVPAGFRQTLDLRTGVLMREETARGGVPMRAVRFASATLPGVMLMRVEAAPRRLAVDDVPLQAGEVEQQHDFGRPRFTAVVAGAEQARIAAMSTQSVWRGRSHETLERIAAFGVADDEQAARASAERLLDVAERTGFDHLLAAHRAAWAARWDEVDARIPDDPVAQRAVRFALFQLWSHTAHTDELAVGARGLSGTGYAGHVFWDSDVFVLPAIATMDPRSARAILGYRLKRLPRARARAREQGCRGAHFPWESAATGDDVTPDTGLLGSNAIPILTGRLEEHITADVAWATVFATEWAGTRLSAAMPEAALVVETARYWASRCRIDSAGRAHIESVIGPDEYHEAVDDNAYTNVMARWNLRHGAKLLGDDAASRAEAAEWRRIADALVDGYDPDTGRYEQFAGYDELEPLTLADVAPPPVAADLFLGVERVGRSQIIKQPDVLMLHHLVPDELAEGSLGPNLDFYGPRTAHGSSLSPAISASLLARAGRADEALDLLRIALRLDLDDITQTTASGLHLATIGGVWQCVLFGFAGVRVRGDCLHVDPHLPSAWPRLEVRFRALGRRVRLTFDDGETTVNADGPISVRLKGGPVMRIPGSGQPRDAEGEVL